MAARKQLNDELVYRSFVLPKPSNKLDVIKPLEPSDQLDVSKPPKHGRVILLPATEKTFIERFAEYERLAQEVENVFWTVNRGVWIEQLDRELSGKSSTSDEETKGDLWHILDWILASSENTENELLTKKLLDRVLATLGRLSLYWYFRAEKMHGDEDEATYALKYLDKALERPNRSKLARGIALFGAGLLYRATGDLYAAHRRLKKSEQEFQAELGNKNSNAQQQVKTLTYLAFVQAFRGLVDRDRSDNKDALRYIDSSLNIFKNDLRFLWGEALTRSYRASILVSHAIRAIKDAEESGDTNKADTYNIINTLRGAIEELTLSEEQFRTVGDPWGTDQTLIYRGIAIYQLARCEESLGMETSKQRYEEARKTFVDFLNRSIGVEYNVRGIARCLCGLAAIAINQDMPQRAMNLLGAAKAIRIDYLHADRVLRDISEYLDTAGRAADLIGDKTAALAALTQGSTMVRDVGIDKIIAFAVRPNLPIHSITVDTGHITGQMFCGMCGGSVEQTYRSQECWGKRVIVMAEKIPTYRCVNCGIESLDADAAAAFLRETIREIEATGDADTVRSLQRQLLVVQS